MRSQIPLALFASYSPVSSVSEILVPYHRSLSMHLNLVETLRNHSLSFEDSKLAVSRWVAQEHLEEHSWEAHWEDICEVEIKRWGDR